jgi:hypothetical protein
MPSRSMSIVLGFAGIQDAESCCYPNTDDAAFCVFCVPARANRALYFGLSQAKTKGKDQYGIQGI